MDRIESIVEDILFDFSIISPPVNIFSVITEKGIIFKEADFEDEISGVLDLRSTDSEYIFVNKKHSNNRKRFSAAHELGHYMLHTKSGLHMDRQSFFRNKLSQEGTNLSEIEANRFAAEILMPRKMLLNDLRSYVDLIDTDRDPIEFLSKRYCVSATAMSIRIQPILNEMGFSDFSPL